MRFLVDAQLPPSLAAWLRVSGHDADHVMDAGGLEASDAEIWELAVTGGYVIVTKDRDFVDWARARSPKARILWIRFGNRRRDALLAKVEAAWPVLLGALESDVTIIEVGR